MPCPHTHIYTDPLRRSAALLAPVVPHDGHRLHEVDTVMLGDGAQVLQDVLTHRLTTQYIYGLVHSKGIPGGFVIIKVKRYPLVAHLVTTS